ncbi:olfactory receptor 1018 [Cricetulus griseus]
MFAFIISFILSVIPEIFEIVDFLSCPTDEQTGDRNEQGLSAMVGNAIIITIIQIEPRLHTPMYFFLTNLSFLDICYTSTNVPQMLSNMVGSKKTIPFARCATQMYFSLSFGMIECVLLGVMAYDRYVAICHPLHYTVLMDQNTCVQLAAISWSSSFLSSMVINVLTLSLPYCGPNVLNHFFCEVPSVLRLACTDTSLTELVVFVFSIIIVFIPFLLIIVSYARILLSVLRMRSASGRHKALSTCASHLTVVTLFYGTAIFMYMRPQSKSSRAGGKHIHSFTGIRAYYFHIAAYTEDSCDIQHCGLSNYWIFGFCIHRQPLLD